MRQPDNQSTSEIRQRVAAGVLSRQIIIIALLALLVAASAEMMTPVGGAAFALLGVWFAATLGLRAAANRLEDRALARWHGAFFAVDIGVLTLAEPSMGAAGWLGPLAFALVALNGGILLSWVQGLAVTTVAAIGMTIVWLGPTPGLPGPDQLTLVVMASMVAVIYLAWSVGVVFGRLLADSAAGLAQARAELAAVDAELTTSRTETAAWGQKLEDTIASKTSQLQGRNNELVIVNAVSQALGHSLDLRSILTEVANRLAKVFGTAIIEISVRSESDDNVMVVAREGAVAECFYGNDVHLIDQAVSGKVVRSGRPVVTDQVVALPEALANHGWAGASHLAVFPVRSKERALGTLAMVCASTQQLSDADHRVLGSIGNMIGAAVENSQLYRRIKHISDTDPVTGLYNHRFIIKRLNIELRRAMRYKHALGVLMMDIDRFKTLNDTHGHMLGDRALKRIALASVSACRATDIMGRYGGDEFLIILPETQGSDAKAVADRILDGVRRLELPIDNRAGASTVSVSLGLAVYDGGPAVGVELISAADKNLYRSKSAGGNRLTSV